MARRAGLRKACAKDAGSLDRLFTQATLREPRVTMPYLKIQTNLPLSKKAERSVLKTASALIAAELEKPEEFVMLAIQPDTPMLFAGSDDPVAFLELKSIGLPAKKTKTLSRSLCTLIEEHLGILKSRVYVKFIDVKHGMWGWKGDTF
ncbi:MAG: phenylpyruvate tautomerase MIF-related protein [Nibricoccus sp.]